VKSTGASPHAWGRAARDERGVALISALSALLLLTPLVLALLSVGTFELLISRNLVDTTQALYNAEAGIEWAFSLLMNTPDWAVVAAELVPPAGLLPVGTTISVRQDDQPNDLAITATGAVRGAQRTILAIIRRDSTASTGASASPPPAQGTSARHAVVSWRERH